MKEYIEKIPTWAISAIINDDKTGLKDSEIDMIQEWFEQSEYDLYALLMENRISLLILHLD